MGASSQDIAVTVISNGQEAYYSSYKGFGNIMWEVNFGLYSDSDIKPNADTIFDFAEKTIWEDSIDYLDAPLEDPVYGKLIVNFDTKTIIDDNGYGPWDRMFLEWFVNSVFRASTKYEGFSREVLITKKSIIHHLKKGNLYVGTTFKDGTDLMLPKNVDKASEVFIDLGYNENNNQSMKAIEKGYSWGKIKRPEGWTFIEKE